MSRPRIQIRWIMLAIAGLAVLLALPTPGFALLLIPAIIASMILVPVWLAPHGRRFQVAYWAAALHPLVFLAWLAAWRLVLDPWTLDPTGNGWYRYPALVFVVPYILAEGTRWYLPVFIAFFIIAASLTDDRRSQPALAIPLWAMTVVWLSTWIVLEWDPFKMRDWFWG